MDSLGLLRHNGYAVLPTGNAMQAKQENGLVNDEDRKFAGAADWIGKQLAEQGARESETEERGPAEEKVVSNY